MNENRNSFPLEEPFRVFWKALKQKQSEAIMALQLMERGDQHPQTMRVVAIRLDKGEFKSVEQIETLIKDANASVPGHHWQVTEDPRGYSVILKKDLIPNNDSAFPAN